MSGINLRYFKKAINMGLGSAILELKRNNDENGKFREAVLYACIHNTCFDAQVEDERCDYLFEAIKQAGNKDCFLDAIVCRMGTTGDFHLIRQLCGLLYLFWQDGYSEAGTAIRNKFRDCLLKITRTKKMSLKRRRADILTYLTLRLCDMYGINEFFSCAEKIGYEMLKHRDREIVTLFWLVPSVEEKFGKSFIKRFEKEAKKSESIRYLLQAWQGEKQRDSNISDHMENKIDANYIMGLITTNEPRQKARLGIKLTGIGRRLNNNDETGLRLQLAELIDSSPDEEIKAAIMYVFYECDYPHSFEKLLRMYETAGNKLKSQILAALKRFKDARLRELAVYNLQNNLFVYESLMLLGKYFNNDYELVYQAQKSYKKTETYEYHDISMAIIDLFSRRKATKARKILIYDYHMNRCSFCRKSVVEIMCKNGIIPGYILEECLYDCVWDTRQLAGKYKSRKKCSDSNFAVE